MKEFATTLKAIDNTDGNLKTFVGINIIANNHDEANEIVNNQFPYLTILGEVIKEIDEITGKELITNQN